MSNKEKQRLRRQDKQRQLRKIKSQSPWQKLESGGTVESCLVSGGWRESGAAAVVFVLRELNGRAAVVSFEIDAWCRGLHNAAGRTDVSDLKVDEILTRMRQDMDAVKVSAEEGRKLVASGIRFAKENHFRLPADWQKFAAAVGVKEWSDADLSQFRKEGKLWFVGELDDLTSAYLGDVDEFLGRQGVHIVARSKDGQEMDVSLMRTKLETMKALMAEALQPFLDKTIAWCRQRNEEPSVLLAKVAERMSVGISLSLALMEEWKPERLADGLQGAMDVYLSTLGASDKEEANRGVMQFLKCMDETNSKAAWVEALTRVQEAMVEREAEASGGE